jgi:F-type H+-transporting ATPase subunit b
VFESFLGVNPWTALFILLNTLTIYFVAKRFLFAPVMQMIEDRQKEIDDMYTDANTAKESAMALESAYKDKLSVATETGERIVKDAITRGQQREEEIIRQANADAAAIMDKAAASIAQEKKKAINEAKDEISDIAIAIAEKVVARQISSDDQQKLVDEFINGLGE